MKFYEPTEYVISTMVNLCHYYYPENDSIIYKINNDIAIGKKGINWNDRKNEIVVGLHEANKPVTLICPRPQIINYRQNSTDYEDLDDNMNIVLSKFTSEEIFNAMYDEQIIFKINGNNN